ncbi:MAG: hypothetical protein AAGL49_09530 [Pseudomonadota bacterium]
MNPMKSFRGWSIVLAVAAMLASCASEPPPEPPAPPAFTFGAGEPITLFVEDVDVVEVYEPPLAEPNVEHFYQAKPADIVRAWAERRIRAAGEGAALQVSILDASVVEEPVIQEAPGGLFGGLRRDLKDAPNRRLKGRLLVNLSYDGAYGTFTVDAETLGFVDINKRASLNIVEEQYNAMLLDMADKLDEALTRRVNESMADLVLGM